MSCSKPADLARPLFKRGFASVLFFVQRFNATFRHRVCAPVCFPLSFQVLLEVLVLVQFPQVPCMLLLNAKVLPVAMDPAAAKPLTTAPRVIDMCCFIQSCPPPCCFFSLLYFSICTRLFCNTPTAFPWVRFADVPRSIPPANIPRALFLAARLFFCLLFFSPCT